jgi:cell division protein FtsB
MRKVASFLGVVLVLAVLVTGCGPDYKKESEQLKAQLTQVQQEQVALKGQVTTLRADSDALKKQVADLTQEKQLLEEKLKEAEAKMAAKPGGKPPLRPRKK